MEIGVNEDEKCPRIGILSLFHFSKFTEAITLVASFLLILALIMGIMDAL